MKNLRKINLLNLSQTELAKREQNVLRGGLCACIMMCLCAYAGPQQGPDDSFYGGSSSNDNGDANADNVTKNNRG